VIKLLALWDFSLSLYSKPHIAECCLHLQDTYDVNITILLWSAWLEQQQIQLTYEKLTAALTLIESWDTDYVQTLRKLRRQMKQEFAHNLVSVSATRELIKKAELAAEKQALHWLENLAGSWSVAASEIARGENIAFYLASLNISLAIIAQVKKQMTSVALG
jgi:uncharacterized protein (TIGR02444 family)